MIADPTTTTWRQITGVHHPLLHHGLHAMQEHLAGGMVAFRCLLPEERVEIGVAAIGVGARPEHGGFDAAGRVAESTGPQEHEPLQLFLSPGQLPYS
jgi:hypothetical protein